ncbi:MAG: type II secretion system protein GspM [Desulfobacterales bacterium]|jgi:general secretion pathway protein M|nr:type II secretion system protein GspM [Desulfobacterales bacterium]
MSFEPVLKHINLSKLSRREKFIVAGGGGLLALFLLIQLVIVPVFERNARMTRAVQSKSQILADMQRLKSEYDSLSARAQQSEARFTQRDKGFTLFSFLDQLAGQARVKERVSYMRPTKTEQKNSPLKLSRVEMKLEAVTLEQLTAFLHGVETSRNMVSVSKLSITRRDQKEGLLDAILQVETLEL